MRVSCPNCQTEYDVPDAALAGRQRKLRCAQCGTQFIAGPLVEPESFGEAPPVSPPPAPLAQFAPPPAPPQFVPAPAQAAPLQAAPVQAAPVQVPPSFDSPQPTKDDWPRPAAAPLYSPAAEAPDNVRTLADAPVQKPYVPPQLRPVEVDPQEARQIADRESFAALLESSRQASALEPEEIHTERGRRLFSPWLISILVLLLVVGLIVIERSLIMQLWPPSIRLFEALGLAK